MSKSDQFTADVIGRIIVWCQCGGVITIFYDEDGGEASCSCGTFFTIKKEE